MTKLFISYRRTDDVFTGRIYDRLKSKFGASQIFKDVDNIPLGKDFREVLATEVQACDVVLVVISSGWADLTDGDGQRRLDMPRDFVRTEIELALERDIPVVPILLGGAVMPSADELPESISNLAFRHAAHVRTDPDFDTDMQRICAAIESGGSSLHSNLVSTECPYRGLEAFRVEDANFYFGREDIVKLALKKIGELSNDDSLRFLAIIGASGSGKSSLAYAGIVAALMKGSTSDWPIVDFRPGHDPVEGLAAALVTNPAFQASAPDVGELIKLLKENSQRLHQQCRLALEGRPDTARVLVLVDQFEEMFTLCPNEDEEIRQAAIDNLIVASTKKGGRTIVLTTMRADFYGKALRYPALAAALTKQQVGVSPMTDDEFRRAMERPCQLAGGDFEAGLVNMMVHDARGQIGALPFLQQALRQLWEMRDGKLLTVKDYLDFGRLEGAIEHQANAVYGKLNDEEREACRKIFMQLTQPGEGTEDTKRQAALEEFGSSKAVTNTLRQLAAERLITVEVSRRQQEQSIVEVAHEALIRGWSTLRKWIDSNRQGILTQIRLTQSAKDWREHHEDHGFLYRSVRLAEVEEWLTSHGEILDVTAQEFLQKSLDLRDRQKHEEEKRRAEELQMQQKLTSAEQEKAEAERQRAELAEKRQKELAKSAVALRSRGRLFASAAIGGLVLAVTAAVFWSSEREQRERAHNAEAVISRRNYVGGIMLANHELKSGNFSQVSALLDGARNIGDQDYRGWEWYYLDSLIEQGSTKIEIGQARSVAWNPETDIVAFAGDFGCVTWDKHTSKIQSLTNAACVDVDWEPTGAKLAAITAQGSLIVWERDKKFSAPAQKQLDVLKQCLRFSNNGQHVALGGEDGAVHVLDLHTGAVVDQFDWQTPILDVDWLPNSTAMIVAHGDNSDDGTKITVRNVGDKINFMTSNPGPIRVRAVAGHPTESLFAASADVGSVVVISATGEVMDKVQENTMQVTSVAWDANGQRLAASGHGDTIIIWKWDGRKLRLERRISGHTGVVRCVRFSPDASELVSCSDDGTIRFWPVEPPATARELTQVENWTGAVKWIDGGNSLVVSFMYPPPGETDRCSLKIVDAASGTTLKELHGEAMNVSRPESRIWGCELSPDRKRIATSSRSKDGAVRVFDLEREGHQAIVGAHSWGYDAISVAWSPKGDLLASLAGRQQKLDGVRHQTTALESNDELFVWNVGKPLSEVSQPEKVLSVKIADGEFLPACSLAWSDNGLIAAPFGPDTIRVWNSESWTNAFDIPARSNSRIHSLEWNNDGRQLAIGFSDGTFQLWDMETKHDSIPHRRLHRSMIREIAWHPVHRDRLATASRDGTVKIMDTVIGEEILTLSAENFAPFNCIAWSPDGKKLAAGTIEPASRLKSHVRYKDGGGRILIWDASAGYDSQ